MTLKGEKQLINLYNKNSFSIKSSNLVIETFNALIYMLFLFFLLRIFNIKMLTFLWLVKSLILIILFVLILFA